MNTAIIVENLCKKYSGKPVLDNVSFEVKQGEIFALLGMNGAGKTTTFECIEGLRKYESGNVVIHGKLGVHLQSSSLPANITAKEAFLLFSKWNMGKVKDPFQDSLIHDFQNQQYSKLSTGQKRRLHLALALIGNPDIILLDEPTAGLDVEGRAVLHEYIKKLKDQNKTIILASHDMAEVETLCDRIAILKDGEIIFVGTPSELTAQAAKSDTKISVKTSAPMPNGILVYSEYLGEYQGYYVYLAKTISDSIIELMNVAKSTNADVYDLRVEHDSFEQRFLEIAKESKA